MFIVLAIDALEYRKIEEFNCSGLKQKFYGKTDISEFSQPRTMVLWSSFMTGQNKEKEVMVDGDKEMWSKKWNDYETFFAQFKNPVVLDLPGYSYNLEAHEKSRDLLKAYFNEDNNETKARILDKYNNDAFDHHRNVRQQFYKALEQDHDFILAYFSVVDVIGHLNFGKRFMMKMLYNEMEGIYKEIVENHPHANLLVISDHGMSAVGMFGDHSDYGFWSTNFKDLGTPKITEIGQFIVEMK